NPPWIHPNADESGYYRWTVPTAMLEKLAADAPRFLSPRERVGLLANLRALLDSGGLDVDQYLGFLLDFAADADPEVVSAAATGIAALRATFVTPQNRDEFAAYVRSAVGP